MLGVQVREEEGEAASGVLQEAQTQAETAVREPRRWTTNTEYSVEFFKST